MAPHEPLSVILRTSPFEGTSLCIVPPTRWFASTEWAQHSGERYERGRCWVHPGTMTKRPSPIPLLVDELSRVEGLRRPATWIAELGGRSPRRLANWLEHWLGHPAHPVFTDLPVGFWTSSLVVDLVGGKRGAP